MQVRREVQRLGFESWTRTRVAPLRLACIDLRLDLEDLRLDLRLEAWLLACQGAHFKIRLCVNA